MLRILAVRLTRELLVPMVRHLGRLFLLLFLPMMSGHAKAQSLVITHVTVIDATGRAPQPNMTVIVDAGHIAAVGSGKKVHFPKNAQVVDGDGKFLIPGLWDMHVHGASDTRAPWSHLLFVANGVVGVRDMAGPPDAHKWRSAQGASEDPSPAVYLGSPIVDGPNPVWSESIVAANESEGRAAVEEQQQRGAEFIKVYSRLPRNVYFAIADEAKQRGIPFAGHVPESVTAAEASDAGQKSIEHLTGIAEGCTKEEKSILSERQQLEASFRAPNATMSQKIDAGKSIIGLDMRVVATYDEASAQALFQRFVKNKTWECPTLTLLRAQTDQPLPAGDERLTYLTKSLRQKWETGYYKNLPPQPRAAMARLTALQFDESMKIVGQMYRAGVPILAGTDAMNPQCFPGFGIHDELALLVDAGLTPLAAIQTATRNAAEFMGQLDRRGTIEPGKIADLLLLEKNPLADIHNTRSIEAVVLNGKLYPRAALDAMLTKARTLANHDDPSAASP